MKEDAITKVTTEKRYDTVRGLWFVDYVEHHHAKTDKEQWDWSASTSYYCDTEVKADTKLVEVNSEKVAKEKELKLK